MSNWLKETAAEVGSDLALRVVGGVAVVVGLLACVGLKRLLPDCPPSGYAIAMLGGVVATMAVAAGVCRAVTGDTDLLFGFTPGQWRLLVVGFALAFALAGGLFAYEWHDQRVAAAATAQHQAEQERYAEQMRGLSHIPLPPRPTPRRP